MSRQQCVSVLEKISAITFSLTLSVSFRSYGGGGDGGRHSLSCITLPLPDHCAKFPGSSAKDNQDSIADDERFVLCPSWELVS